MSVYQGHEIDAALDRVVRKIAYGGTPGVGHHYGRRIEFDPHDPLG